MFPCLLWRTQLACAIRSLNFLTILWPKKSQDYGFGLGTCVGWPISTFLGIYGTLPLWPRTTDLPDWNTCTYMALPIVPVTMTTSVRILSIWCSVDLHSQASTHLVAQRRTTIPPRDGVGDGGDFQERFPKGGGTCGQTTWDFSLSNYICIAGEYHDILLLNNPSSSLLITNRYPSSRMNNLRGKKSLNKSRWIVFLKKSNFLVFLLRTE